MRVGIYGMRDAPVPDVARLVAPAPDGRVYALYATAVLRIGDAVEETIALPVDPARAQADAMDSAPDGTLRLRVGGSSYTRAPGGAWQEGGDGPAPRAEVAHAGATWVPTRGSGILRRRTAPLFRSVRLARGPRVHALAGGPDGTIWCATNNGVAAVAADGSVEDIREIEGQPLGTVTAVAVDREGRVWIGSGSSFKGLFRREPDGWRRLNGIDGYVHRITQDPSGALWFAVLSAEGEGPAATRGAWCFADGQFRPAPTNVDLPSARVYDVVARDRRGTLWIATLKGLAAYEGQNRVAHYLPRGDPFGDEAPPGAADPHRVLLGEKVWCLCAARDGSLWIGYQQTPGTSRLARGGIEHFDVDDGLCDGDVWAIAEGRPGVFWFATAAGLSRYDGLVWSCFRNEEGLGDEGIWPLLPLEDGTLWVGTLGAGLVHMAPLDVEPPRTTFREASYEVAHGRTVDVTWTGVDAWYDTPAVDLRYRWRLDDGRWSNAIAATSLTIVPPPGRHTLQVQALDRFGNAENPPASVEILVIAPWSFPFAAVLAAGAALLVVGFLLGRTRRR